MTKRLQHIAPLQLGIVLAALYGALSLIFVPFLLLASAIGAKTGNSAGFFAGGMIFIIFIPVLYATMGFIGGIISAALYNLISKWTGGIEFTFVDPPQP